MTYNPPVLAINHVTANYAGIVLYANGIIINITIIRLLTLSYSPKATEPKTQ